MKVSKEILDLVPYRPGKPISETQREFGLDHVVKLASNENPLGVSPLAKQAVLSAMDELHRYPDAAAYALIDNVSKIWGFRKQMLAAGNGSNEIIDLLIRIFCEPGEGILTSEAAFVAYQVCAQAARVKVHTVPLKENLAMDLVAIGDHLQKTDKINLVFIPNPNNPTGTYANESEVLSLLKRFEHREDVLFVFDEAYNEFVRAKDYSSAQKFLKDFKNIAIIRTFSKAYGLAGLRLGILIAPEFVIELYNRVRNPFNVNELVQVAAIAALQDSEFVEKTCKMTWDGLDYFYAELKKMGLPYVESQGNFVLFDTLRNSREVYVELLKEGVILRPVNNYGFERHMRVSIGLPQENQFAIEKLKKVLPKIPLLKK